MHFVGESKHGGREYGGGVPADAAEIIKVFGVAGSAVGERGRGA
jgi:hypothetical protein